MLPTGQYLGSDRRKWALGQPTVNVSRCKPVSVGFLSGISLALKTDIKPSNAFGWISEDRRDYRTKGAG